MWYYICSNLQVGRIQTSQTVGQLYSAASTDEVSECSLVNAIQR